MQAKRRAFVYAALLAGAYALVARLGLALDAVGAFATLVWPPTGISLAAVFLGGPRLGPGVFLGALLANFWMGAPLGVAAGIATGNTLEALVGAYLLGRAVFSPTLERVRDVAALVVLAALVSTLLSATIGVGSLGLGGVVARAHLPTAWWTWWLGDVIGNLVVAPLLLSWSRPPAVRFGPSRSAEALALAVSVLAVGAFIFLLPWAADSAFAQQPFLMFPVLVWAALRFGPRGAASASFFALALAVTGTVLGRGPFAGTPLHEGLASLQVFAAVMAVGALVLAAVAAERSQALHAMREGYALLRAVMDGTTDAVFAKDAEGHYLLMNGASPRSLHHPPDSRSARGLDRRLQQARRGLDLPGRASGTPAALIPGRHAA